MSMSMSMRLDKAKDGACEVIKMIDFFSEVKDELEELSPPLPPCRLACPISTDAPGYIAAIAKGRLEEAMEIIRRDNPLPAVCGRVCHHPCEANCRAGEEEEGEPISIRALKRFVTDHARNYRVQRAAKEERRKRKEKVAIVGSGPCGLSAAHSLVQMGYQVTVFEALPVAGGMLAVGIPSYRLPKDLLHQDIEAIKDEGVEILTGVSLGKDISLDGLLKEYEAVLLALGAHKSLKLGIPGEDAEGVLHSLSFLKAVNLGEEVKIGPKVGVIGGGNSAVDAARVAIRLPGVDSVSILYRRTRAEMPAFPEEVEAALEEGVDIQFLTAPTEVLTRGQDGRLEGVECIRMELGEPDESGRRRPVPIPGSEFVQELDTLIVAISEQPEIPFPFRDPKTEIKIRLSKWNTIEVDPETLATDQEGVFAGGDVVTGPNTVIDAIAAGKVAARSIDRWMRGLPLRRYRSRRERPPVRIDRARAISKKIPSRSVRPEMPHLPIEERKGFKEVELGLTEEMAVREARRCLRCDCGKCSSSTVGPTQILELLRKLSRGEGEEEDLHLLRVLSSGLEETLPLPNGKGVAEVLSRSLSSGEYEEHVEEKRCAKCSCEGLTTYRIIPERCTMCGECKEVCPKGAIFGEEYIPYLADNAPYTIDPEKCTKCGLCLPVCAEGAIELASPISSVRRR